MDINTDSVIPKLLSPRPPMTLPPQHSFRLTKLNCRYEDPKTWMCSNSTGGPLGDSVQYFQLHLGDLLANNFLKSRIPEVESTQGYSSSLCVRNTEPLGGCMTRAVSKAKLLKV